MKPGKRQRKPVKRSRRVFVVHGRNEAARRAMFEFLRALGLRPMEWDDAVRLTGKGAPYIGECWTPPWTTRKRWSSS